MKASEPPDVRGPTAPLPAATLAAGAAALLLSAGGAVVVLAYGAIKRVPLSRYCIGEGIVDSGKNPITGARSVCGIVEALRSPAEAGLTTVAVVLGLLAAGAGVAAYRRMDSKRKRNESVAGAVLGMQGALIAAFLLWFRHSHNLIVFAHNFLDFPVIKGYWGLFLNGAKNTLILAFGGEIGGVVLGLVLALFTISKQRTVRAPARVYINFFRGTPLLWQLSFAGLGVPLALGLNISVYSTALIVFSLNTGAYAAGGCPVVRRT